MPHLHGNEATDSDTVSSVSACSKNINADQDDAECPVKAAESAANRLLSLAALAEEHGKCNVVVDVPAAARDETKEGSTVVDAAPASPPAVPPMHQHQHEEGREVPPAAPGMSPHWAMVGGHPPRFTGFFRQPGIHSVYAQGMAGAPSGVSPIPPEHSPRFMRRGAPRGGFPMWAGPPPPRPPYHPHPRAVGPSSLPPHFRRPIPPMFMARQCSANDEELERRSPAPKRVSLGYPPKSILKKPRLDPHATAVSPENCDESVEQDARPKSSLEALAESAAAISEASQRSQEESTTDEAKAAIESAAAVEKTAFSFSDDGSPKKQRIISPASSNEYPKAEYDDEMSYSVEGSLSPDHSRVMAGSPHRPYPSPGGPFRMGHMRPPMPPLRPGLHGSYVAYPHPHGMRPFPAGMPSPVHVPSMYHPRSMSARGRPAFAVIPPFYARARIESPSPSPSSFSPEQQRPKHVFEQKAASAPSPTVATSQARKSPSASVMEPAADAAGNGRRCIPLNPPVPSKYWSDAEINKEVILPDFHRLVNFPDLLIKGRNSGGGDGEGGCANGKKRCVMCGQLRVSATYVRAKKASAESASSLPEDPSSADASGSNHIIPRQNKGVCTACDVTVWVALELDAMEIKWCKGCKNFRPWCHFGDKSLATKCLRCRDRQKEKYALQKSANRRRSSASSMDESASGMEEKKAGDANDMHHCSLTVVAANGLRSLMKAV